MKPFKQELFWVSGVYFLILLSIALCVRDNPNQPDAFNTTSHQISVGLTRFSDAASFATAAIDVAESGRISSANEWIFNLWPPGFILMQALIIRLLGPETPMILVLQILAVVLFTIVLMLLYVILNALLKRNFVAMGLPLMIFAFPVSRVFLLQPEGITLGESFSIGTFLACALLTFFSVERHSLFYAACAGLCLALSAYFRSQFEFILLVLTGWGILFLIGIRLIRLRSSIDLNVLRMTGKSMIVVILVAHAATIPWRIYRWINFYQGTPSWVQTTELHYKNSVLTNEYLKDINGDWIIAGTGNIVCRIDPSTCGDTENAKKLFFKTFIEHPVQWYSIKSAAIGKYWFSSVKNYSSVKKKSTPMDIAINGLLLLGIFILIALSFTCRVRSHVSWVLLTWFNISLFSAYAVIFSLAHYEVRYFYLPKIAGMTMLLIVASMYLSETNKKPSSCD